MADVDPLDLLAQELGFALKSEQREALQSLLRKNDVFCVLPTGFGKSLIYQMFVYAKKSSSLQRPTIIVISPLKSIMDKQIASNEFGLSACELRLDCETLTAIRGGDVQVVYAAAEQVLHEKFTTLLKQGDTTFRRSLSLIVVDESHTAYTWYAGPQEITTFTDK